MKITIACIGLLKPSPELELIRLYLKRFEWSVKIAEGEAKKALKGSKRQEEEGRFLLKAAPPGSFLVALDERGQSFTSTGFAEKLTQLQLSGHSAVTFLMGGADGHGAAIHQAASLTLSLGKMTWPHKLARVMLVEQLYRAQQIIKDHPYHRE